MSFLRDEFLGHFYGDIIKRTVDVDEIFELFCGKMFSSKLFISSVETELRNPTDSVGVPKNIFFIY